MMEQGARRVGAAPKRPCDTADYIAELTEELAELARSGQLDMLAYLLDMAKLEARAAGTGGRKRASEPARRLKQAAEKAKFISTKTTIYQRDKS